jgi:hypothetical protein
LASRTHTPNKPKANKKAPNGFPIVNYIATPQAINKEAKQDFLILITFI